MVISCIEHFKGLKFGNNSILKTVLKLYAAFSDRRYYLCKRFVFGCFFCAYVSFFLIFYFLLSEVGMFG